MAKNQSRPQEVIEIEAPDTENGGIEMTGVEEETTPSTPAVQGAEPLGAFEGFVGDNVQPDEDEIDIDVDAQRQFEDDMREVAIIPRVTMMRVRIGNDPVTNRPAWYNFIKGKEILVPNHVAKWLKEQGVI